MPSESGSKDKGKEPEPQAQPAEKEKKTPDPTAVALRRVQSIIRQFQELGTTEQSFVIMKLSELRQEAEQES